MSEELDSVFDALKPVLTGCAKQLAVVSDVPGAYRLDTRRPSPFPQHKGHPMFFGAVKTGKSYVSLHLMPLYMCPKLNEGMSPELKKRMQGKSCFNFRKAPEKAVAAELKRLAKTCLADWDDRGGV